MPKDVSPEHPPREIERAPRDDNSDAESRGLNLPSETVSRR
jgi:hypothetical protein